MPKHGPNDGWVHVNLYGLKDAAMEDIRVNRTRHNIGALIRMLLAKHLGEDEPNVQQGRRRPKDA